MSPTYIMNFNKIKSLSPFIGLFFLLVIHPLTPLLYNFKYNLLLGIIFVFSIKLFFDWKGRSTLVSKYDLCWIVLCVYSFISYFWAIDPALIWNPSFSYILLFIGVISLRQLASVSNLHQKFHQLFLWAFSIVFIQSVLFIIISSIVEERVEINLAEGFLRHSAEVVGLPLKKIYIDFNLIGSWNYFFGHNWNFVNLYYLSLLPFVIIFRKERPGICLIQNLHRK